jgi:hypothetical protein
MLTTLHLCKGEVVISFWFSLLFYVWSSFLQWTCSLQIISCSPSTSLSSEVEFLTTKSIVEVEFLTTKSIGEVEFLTTKLISKVEFLTTKLISEVEFLTTKSIVEVEFLTTKLKYILLYTFPCKWISLGYFYIFHTDLSFLDEVNSPNSSPSRMKAYSKGLKFMNFEFLKRSHKKTPSWTLELVVYDRYAMNSVF